MIRLDRGELVSEQMNLLSMENLVISFQEQAGNVFAPVRERNQKGERISAKGPDFPAFSPEDVVIDTYLVKNSQLGDRIEALGSAFISTSRSSTSAGGIVCPSGRWGISVRRQIMS